MAKLSTYALAGALAIALAPVAGHAADLPEPPLLEPVAPVEFGSAWYLRGDVGYKKYRDPKAVYDDSVYRAIGLSGFKNENMKDAAIFGGGVGYKFNKWFRSDVTVDYETKSRFSGNTACIDTVHCGGRDSDNWGKISAWSMFLNGYVDLIDLHGFTPYVGGGVGAARVDLKSIGFVDYLDNKKGVNHPHGKTNTGSYDGEAEWNFAWNVQAGLAFHMTDNLLLDANYRFVDLGDARTKSIRASPSKNARVKIDDIQAHEVRVGLRYMFD